MPAKSHVHVRQMEVGDFAFVQTLAAKQANFTVPPLYVLWLLLRVKDAVCLVAEQSSGGPLAYLLAVPIDAPSRALHVWQLATSDSGQRKGATLVLLSEFGEIAERLRIRTISFSTIPGSPAFRLIRRYTAKVFSATPKAISTIPSLLGQNEEEYRFKLAPRPRKLLK
jgi:hypothetical protein